jgi:hypothetical protein
MAHPVPDGRSESLTVPLLLQFAPHKHMNPRRKFTVDEDLRLRSLVEQIGSRHWETVASFMPGRTARQCRDRYKNYLVESLVAAPWTPEEDQVLQAKHAEIGPKWVEISRHLSGRSGNAVKNRWHKHIAKMAPQEKAPERPFQAERSMVPPMPAKGKFYPPLDPGNAFPAFPSLF